MTYRQLIVRIARAALCSLVMVLALFATVPAIAGESSDAVTRRLVLTSAVVRQAYEQRAAASQFETFQRLAEVEKRLRESLRQGSANRQQIIDLKAEIDDVETQLQNAFSALAAKDNEFAIKLNALEAEMRGVVSAASPEKLALLERYANGDRTGVAAKLEELTYAENRAREVAAAKAGAENLKQLLVIKQDLLLRGEVGFPDLVKILQDIVRLDPADLESATLLISNLNTLRRFDEAADLVDATEDKITDPWERLDFEARVVDVRANVRSLDRAIIPVIRAFDAVERIKSFEEMASTQQSDYCRAVITTFNRVTEIKYFNEQVIQILFRCYKVLGRDEQFILPLFSSLINFAEYAAEYRNIDLLEKIALPLIQLNGDGTEGYDYVRFILEFGKISAKVRYYDLIGEKVDHSEFLRGNSIDSLEDFASNLLGPELFKEQSASLLAEIAGMQFHDGQLVEARALLQKAESMDTGPIPESSRADLDRWSFRVSIGSDLAKVCLDQQDLPCAERALERVRPIIRRLQVLRPLDDRTMFMRYTRSVYLELMDLALLSARLKLEQGHPAEADARLLDVMAKLAPYMDEPWWREAWPVFRTQALILSGEIRAQQGQTDSARQQLGEALALAQAEAAKEPRVFFWKSYALQARFRAAQLDDDGSKAAGVRAEYDQLMESGKVFDPHLLWVKDLLAWKPGRPARWRNAAPQ